LILRTTAPSTRRSSIAVANCGNIYIYGALIAKQALKQYVKAKKIVRSDPSTCDPQTVHPTRYRSLSWCSPFT
jgi:hypothetical protein